MINKNLFIKSFLFLIIFFVFLNKINGQENQQTSDLRKKIEEYEKKLTEIRQQKNTLFSQIQYMNTQIYLTNLKIQETEEKIEKTIKEIGILETKIEDLDSSLNHLSRLMINKIIQNYKQKNFSFLDIFFQSENTNNLINKIKYIKIVRDNNQKLIVQVQKTKINFEEQKNLREKKKKELDNLKIILARQQDDLKNQKLAKQKLLIDTQNNETVYQQLLSQARSQLSSLSNFVRNQGGATILSGQTICDSWGCYYNQRDSQWGNFIVNNSYDCNDGVTSACTLAKIGCLITSVAMISTHYGKNINPLDIAINSNNFWLNTALLQKGTISAKGININRTTIASYLTNDIVSNRPVIVGINHGVFGTHFLVIKKYENGNYIMNDPYIENGKDKNFTDYYSLNNIFSVDIINF
ncbi:MAG: C39 family peptidase [Patescibacteria group bacterium]|nr:C39 family peptidase [Patescibacteria group bacterium]